MPGLLLIALAGSLLIHGAALFGTDFELFADSPEAPALRAELQAPPAPSVPMLAPQPERSAARHKASIKPTSTVAAVPAPVSKPVEQAALVPEELTDAGESPQPPPPRPPADPVLPASGLIRFAIVKSSLGMQVGTAEYRWSFPGDGSYRLTASSETSGLAGLLRPARLVQESRGRLVAGGLQPESFRSQRQGRTEEGADFDWQTGELRLLRDGSTQPLPAGSQDMLSLNFQLAFIGRLADGASLAVVTARRFERHALDSLGEEDIEVPAGRFRTLHLRALSDSTTEIWIALDRASLPVKIRFTDKKGDSFEQVATELEY